MISRFFWFALYMFVGSLIGQVVLDATSPWSGAVLGALLWMVSDLLSMSRCVRWLQAQQQSASPGRDVSQPQPTVGVWADLTDRMQRMLRKLHNTQLTSKARLDDFLLALQASPNGVVLLDAQGRIEWCNQTAHVHFGLDPVGDVQQYVTNLIREPAFMRYLAAGDFSSSVLLQGRPRLSGQPLSLSTQLHAYGEGRRLLLSSDVTALQQAEAMRRDFVANVSHEIRTPLTVVSGFVETLQNLPLTDAERQHYLALMAQQASRMQTLVIDLLTLSRLEASPLPRQQTWVDVDALMRQCEEDANALSSLLSSSKHHLSFTRSGQACELAGEHTELFSAFANLVTNALRYTPAPGTVAVSWQLLPDGRAEWAVQDNGPGIEPEHLPRLTERFYRIDRSRSRETGGTGLGLAIVKHVVQRHGGELQIQSKLGEGSRFALVFPASRVRLVMAADEVSEQAVH
jgi:two-component system phosphate regulon sensor histidine kinase PhoR